MAEEVSIKLKADTSDAVKSVKDLQNTINGIDKMKRKGEYQDDFLSENDVKRFKRLSSDAIRIYQDFYSQISKLQKQIEDKQREMDRMRRGGVAPRSPMYQRAQSELNTLQSSHDLLHNSQRQIDNLMTSGANSQSAINNMRTGGPLYHLARHFIGRYGGIGGMIYGANKIRGFIGQGANLVTDYNNQLYPYAQQVGGYNGNFDLTRQQVANAGAVNGYTVGQSLSTLYGFTGRAGLSAGDPIKAMQELQAQGRTLGLDPSMLAGVEGGMAQRGSQLNPSIMRQWAYTITGAVDKTKMAGRQQEMVQAFNSLSQEQSTGLVTQTNKMNGNLLAYQTMLGATGLAGFKGQAGANFLSSIDSSMKQGSPQLQLLEGLGTSTPATLGGRLGLQYQMEEGLGNAKNFSSVMKNVNRLGTAITNPQTQLQYRANILKGQFSGTTMHEWMAILSNPQLQKQLESGQTSIDALNKQISKEGESKFMAQYGQYTSSYTGRENQAQANKQKSQMDAGQWFSHMGTDIKSAFYGMPEWAQWPLGIAGNLGGGWAAGQLLGKGVKYLGPKIGGGGGFGGMMRAAGSGIKSVGKGIGSVASKSGNWLKGLLGFGEEGAAAGLGEAGLAGGLEAAGAGLDATGVGALVGIPLALAGLMVGGNALFGGKPKKKAPSSPTSSNPALPSSDTTSYSNSGSGTDSMTPDQIKKISQQGFDTAQLEQSNLKQRKALIQQEQTMLKTEADNLSKMASLYQQMMGSSGGGSLSQSGGDSGSSGGGFWSGLWNGVKGFFGFGGSSSPSVKPPSKLSGSNNASKIYNYLTSQGLSPQAASGVLGNLQQESGLNPAQAGGGLAQWSDPNRWKQLQSYAKSTGGNANSLNTQLGFLMQELKSGSYGSVSTMNKMSPAQAAQYFEKNFEMAGKPNMSQREKNANDFYTQFQQAGGTTTASNATVTHKVVVSGSIDGMTKETSSQVGQAIIQSTMKSTKAPTTNYSQGIGGFA